jgi:hypothetical protein
MENSRDVIQFPEVVFLVFIGGFLAGGYSIASLRVFSRTASLPIGTLVNAPVNSWFTGSARTPVTAALGDGWVKLKPLSLAI